MPLRVRKTVQIVGAAPSLIDCPVIEGAERWIFNSSYLADGGKPVSRVFNLHAKAMILGIQPAAWRWYQAQTCQVYLLEADPEIPTSHAFPLQVLQQYFAQDGVLEISFGCTVDYLIAFALYEEFQHIDLVGIECRSEDEYRDQRPSVEYWMGRARGMGVRMTASASSGLCTQPALYGYNRPTGAPIPPGEKMRWLLGHPHSTWPIPATSRDPRLVNGVFEHP